MASAVFYAEIKPNPQSFLSDSEEQVRRFRSGRFQINPGDSLSEKARKYFLSARVITEEFFTSQVKNFVDGAIVASKVIKTAMPETSMGQMAGNIERVSSITKTVWGIFELPKNFIITGKGIYKIVTENESAEKKGFRIKKLFLKQIPTTIGSCLKTVIFVNKEIIAFGTQQSMKGLGIAASALGLVTATNELIDALLAVGYYCANPSELTPLMGLTLALRILSSAAYLALAGIGLAMAISSGVVIAPAVAIALLAVGFAMGMGGMFGNMCMTLTEPPPT